MTNKSTKRALLASVLSIVICLTMLIGSTFAWFTDSATTGVNKIVSGNLDVDLVDANGDTLVGKTLDFIKADDSTEILWEPGCTYSLPEIYVVNNGNLALKYRINITGINGEAKLNEVIDWNINNADINTEYHLLPKDKSAAITISGHMQETANNNYQNLTIDGISITVNAYQDTVEYDSTTNQYDSLATAIVASDGTSLASAWNNNATSVVLDAPDANIFNEDIQVPEGKTLIVNNATVDTQANYGIGIDVAQNASLTVKDANVKAFEYAQVINLQSEGAKATIDGGIYDGNYLFFVANDAKATFNGGTFATAASPGTVIVVTDDDTNQSMVTVNGGTFYSESISNNFVKVVINGGTFHLNAITDYPNLITKEYIVINGGSFNVDPTAYLADGYVAVKSGEMWVVSKG